MSSEKEKEKSEHCWQGNLFHYHHDSESPEETFNTLMQTNAFTVERIVSSGHFTPSEKPYIQDFDEWVVLLKGKAEITTENNVYQLSAGDYLFLPAGKKHWVSRTSSHPECVWLAVTSKNNNP